MKERGGGMGEVRGLTLWVGRIEINDNVFEWGDGMV